jgi:Uma2 family endonuclease
MKGAPPPLENGDHLSREEFERRYEAMPGVCKAELIQGVVFMPSPVRYLQHRQPEALLMNWLSSYWIASPGTGCASNCSVRLDDDNVLQPDGLLIVLPEHGGRPRISPDGYLVGAPELVVEVAASSASIDLHTKLQTYLDHGVQEYLVWQVLDGVLLWFCHRGDHFEPLLPTATGRVQSEQFPGLWLDPSALLRLDAPIVIATLPCGLADQSHADFVDQLQ